MCYYFFHLVNPHKYEHQHSLETHDEQAARDLVRTEH